MLGFDCLHHVRSIYSFLYYTDKIYVDIIVIDKLEFFFHNPEFVEFCVCWQWSFISLSNHDHSILESKVLYRNTVFINAFYLYLEKPYYFYRWYHFLFCILLFLLEVFYVICCLYFLIKLCLLVFSFCVFYLCFQFIVKIRLDN